ncbi:MAG TPA: MFS transporter [Steroidobacteraceae bacterium]|nr:MFS transporter [Steroidobacteraceae bacterium]
MKLRLNVMMFMEFFTWGGWFVTMGSFLSGNLHATGEQSGIAYSTQAWGAIIAPFIVGLIADRYFHAERLLGIIHIVGGVLMLMLWRAHDFAHFYPYLLAYMILYMPTLALVNAVAFRQMDVPARDFPKVRVWGTIGWIVAGLLISYVFRWDAPAALGHGALQNTFAMCAVTSFLLGVYSFTLPRTPPLGATQGKRGLGSLLGFDALEMLRERNFAVFFFASILICIPLAFYYQDANQFLTEIHIAHATGKQTLGQASELCFMLLLPLFLKRYGMKATLLMGMVAWACRYALFSFGDASQLEWLLLVGIALHGPCYDFFFVSGQIYTDTRAGQQRQAAAQGLITLATYGVGMLVGFSAAGFITDRYSVAGSHDWVTVWAYPAVFAFAVAVLFIFSFRNERLAHAVPQQ